MEEQIQKHPSQIQVSFSRCQCNTPITFYGSDIKCNSYIMLEISQSRKVRNLSNDWFHTDGMILRARLSPNQFAELLTTMNVGGGVPATLESFFSQNIPNGRIEQPIETDKTEIFKIELDQVSKETMLSFNDLITEVENLNLSQKAKTSLLNRLSGVKQQLKSTLPFIIEQAKEQVDNVVTAGRAAIDSFYTGVVTRLGIEALKDNIKVKMITGGEDGE